MKERLEEAIQYIKESYVDNKGILSLLLGDVCKVIEILTDEKIDWNELYSK